MKNMTYQLSEFFATADEAQKTAVLLEMCDRDVELLMDCITTAYETPLIKDVKDLLRSKKKIDAIRVYRGATGASLKDSKDAVEAIQDKYGLHYTYTR